MIKSDDAVCRVQVINPEAVALAKKEMLEPSTALRLAETFKVLGDPTRINILSALAGRELCVCELAAALDMTSSAVSHQLRVLRGARLVRVRKEGKMACYSLDDHHVLTLFEQGLEHVGHTAG